MPPRPLKQRGGGIREKMAESTASKLKIFLGGILVCGVVFAVTDNQPYLDTGFSLVESKSKMMSASFNFEENAKEMKSWRQATEQNCQALLKESSKEGMLEKKEQLEISAISKFNVPDTSALSDSLPSGHRKYEYCHNTFIDLGTNIGDSIGYFVDNALDPCSPLWMQKHPKTKVTKEFPKPHLDVTDIKIYNKGYGSNPLFGMLQGAMTKDKTNIGLPETFCVYGMEGNPAFTSRLQKLENFVMGMKPRPVRHLHIHTESVVTATDGPTKLYLDKTSVEQNFWGSSILSTHEDAQKSAKELGNGTVFAADVMGISLSSLVKNTMEPFKADATPEEKKGGLLIIKMDVEGAEYQILKEIAASGVICDYIKMGNRVVIIVEFHDMSITDGTELRKEKAGSEEAKTKLQECGVEFGKLHASWA